MSILKVYFESEISKILSVLSLSKIHLMFIKRVNMILFINKVSAVALRTFGKINKLSLFIYLFTKLVKKGRYRPKSLHPELFESKIPLKSE